MAYKDKEKKRKHQHEYYLATKERDKEKRKERSLEWLNRNRDKVNKKMRERRLSDPKFREKRLEEARLWRRSNPERMAMMKRRSILKHQYGLTLNQYDEMLKIGNGGCYVCGKIPGNTSAWDRLCIDHNHKTRKNRGLLCHSCNRSLGLLGDSIDRLKKIISYLEKYDRI